MVRFGLATNSEEAAGFYLGADLMFGKWLNLTPTFTLIKYPTFSLGLQWHIGENKWKPVNPEVKSRD